MAIEVACPACGETDDLTGSRDTESISLSCRSCGMEWDRSLARTCDTCGGDDIQTVPLAILEKSRGTQLSMVGTRGIHLCSVCDSDVLSHYHAHRPSPLMPSDLPTTSEEAG